MNYYFLLEDEKSFYKILPYWLNYLDFGCNRVQNINDITTGNNYILESGHGVIQLETKIIFETIETIIDHPNLIDKLIIIVDAEEIGVINRKNRIYNAINEKYIQNNRLIPCSIHVFVCNRCIETWLLGCMGLYPSKKELVSGDFLSYYNFYDIENNDPEKMLKPSSYNKTVATYHFQYLHTLTLDIQKQKKLKNFAYRKSSPNCALYKKYFDSIVQRINITEDIDTFKEFYNFIISESKNNK